ncbi:MAG: hypothetical protein IKT10_02200 [Clostridiales bacterium]|nr:hypothetical protein [Clostridiales bacterium]
MHNLTNQEWVDYNYADWLNHFKENDKARLEVDFSDEPELTDEEKKLIFKSIKAFQMGEHSDGVYLAELAKKFGKEHNEPYYAETMNLFIKEENFHSAYLAWYLKHHNEPKAKKNKLDKIFRDLRHNGKVFTEISVLVTAETIALSYYSALGNVADQIGSKALRAICNQMLHDELPHIVFQTYTLSHFGNKRSIRFFRRFVLECTTIAVYMMYGKLLKAGGYNYKKFHGDNIAYLKQSFKMTRYMILAS